MFRQIRNGGITFARPHHGFRCRVRGRKLCRMRPIVRILAAAGLATLFALPARAETLRYPVKSIDFDIWCTEVEHIAWQRCEKRQPEDMQKFEVYRHTVERYEIQYLRDKENVVHFDETILRNDPVDKRPDATVAKPPGILDGH